MNTIVKKYVFVKLMLVADTTWKAPGYRPTWKSLEKPSMDDARVWLPVHRIEPAEAISALIVPLCPELWDAVTVGSTLVASEGTKETARAIVVSIFESVQPDFMS